MTRLIRDEAGRVGWKPALTNRIMIGTVVMRRIGGFIIGIIISSLILAGCSSRVSETTVNPGTTILPSITNEVPESMIPTLTSTPQQTVSPSAQATQSTIVATTQAAVKISSDLDFKLNDIDGQSVTLSSFSGKAILLNFWATWCGPCKNEMPLLQELNLDWSNRNDAVLLTINMGESAGTVRSFLQSNNYNFRVLLDSQSKVSNKYQVQYIPTSILIGQDGEIKFRIVGAFKDKAALLKAIGDNLPQ